MHAQPGRKCFTVITFDKEGRKRLKEYEDMSEGGFRLLLTTTYHGGVTITSSGNDDDGNNSGTDDDGNSSGNDDDGNNSGTDDDGNNSGTDDDVERLVVEWDSVVDGGVYTYSTDSPVEIRLTNVEGELRNKGASDENALELTCRELFSSCAEFTDMESLSNARRVYKPSEPTAASNVEMMVKVVEDPAYWGLANGLIGVCLAGVKSPKSTRIVHELDAVFRARGKGGEPIAVIAEHKSTLDHVMVEHFSDKIANLTREAAEDGGKCMVSVFRGMQMLPIIYGNAPSTTEFLAVQAAAKKAGILFLGALPAAELVEGSSHLEHHRACKDYLPFVRPSFIGPLARRT